MIIKGDRDASKVLRWVAKAISKDQTREALTALRFDNGMVVATDGYRLHVANRPEIDGEPQGSYQGKIPAGNFIAELDAMEWQEYPKWRETIPSREPEFEIGVNGKYLAEAIKDLGEVRLQFYGAGNPILVNPIEDGNGCFALVMPCHLPNKVEKIAR